METWFGVNAALMRTLNSAGKKIESISENVVLPNISKFTILHASVHVVTINYLQMVPGAPLAV